MYGCPKNGREVYDEIRRGPETAVVISGYTGTL
jgi:hypothetical protein